MGTSAFPLASHFPGLKLVVQDLPGVIAKAEKVCPVGLTLLVHSQPTHTGLGDEDAFSDLFGSCCAGR